MSLYWFLKKNYHFRSHSKNTYKMSQVRTSLSHPNVKLMQIKHKYFKINFKITLTWTQLVLTYPSLTSHEFHSIIFFYCGLVCLESECWKKKKEKYKFQPFILCAWFKKIRSLLFYNLYKKIIMKEFFLWCFIKIKHKFLSHFIFNVPLLFILS